MSRPVTTLPLLVLGWLLLCGASPTTWADVRAGNKALSAGDAATASSRYEAALNRSNNDDNGGERAVLEYNLGTAKLHNASLDGATALLQQALAGADDDSLRSQAAFNLGNAYLQQADGADDPKAALQQAIDAYRQAIQAGGTAPADDARKNLQIAATRLAQQQQQEQQQQSSDDSQQGDGDPQQGQQGENQEGDKQSGQPDAQQSAQNSSADGADGADSDDGQEPQQGQQDTQQADANTDGEQAQADAQSAQASEQDSQGEPTDGDAMQTAEQQAAEQARSDLTRMLARGDRHEANILREAMRRAMAAEAQQQGQRNRLEQDW